MKALVFLATKNLQLKWRWFTTLVAYEPDERNWLSYWLSRLYLVYALLLVAGAALAMAGFLLGTVGQVGSEMSVTAGQLLRPLWLFGVAAFSLVLYLAVRAQPAALAMADLHHLGPAPLDGGTYLLYRLLGTWLRQGLIVWPAALVGLVFIGAMRGGASPGGLALGVATVTLTHLALLGLSWVYGLGRLRFSPLWLQVGAWVPLAAAAVRAPTSSPAGEWLLPPVAAAVRSVVGTTSGPGYPWGLTVLELAVAAVAGLLLWLLARRLPLVLIVEDSWLQAAYSDAVKNGEVYRVRGVDAARRLRHRPATGASPLIRGSGAGVLLGRSILLLARRGPWPPLKTALLAAMMAMGLVAAAAQAPFNLPLVLLTAVVLGGRLLTEPLQGAIYHEEFLFLLPVDARWAVAMELFVPTTLVTAAAWPAAWLAARFLASASVLSAAMALATPGLVWLLALTWAYETLLSKDGLTIGWFFLPNGVVGAVLALIAWGLVAVAAWQVAPLLGPVGAGLAALAFSGLVGYLLLDRCAGLYRTGYVI